MCLSDRKTSQWSDKINIRDRANRKGARQNQSRRNSAIARPISLNVTEDM